MNRKIYIIIQLLANRDIINMEELVLPTSIVFVDGVPQGFSMPFVEDNINMSLFLNNPNVRLELKIKFLKEIYGLLEKTLKIRELQGHFFLGDVHEANFILDLNSQKIKLIDLDSTYINESMISPAKFLSDNPNLIEYSSKYLIASNGILYLLKIV